MTTIRKTYETPETNTLQVHVLTYADLFDMAGRLAVRRDALLKHYRNMTPEQQANVREELAELDIETNKE
jgi:hypothetical protein